MNKDQAVYEAPKVITFGNEALMSMLGPSLSCSGFSGAASGSGCN